MYPHLKFKINKELDIEVGQMFLEVNHGGYDFGNVLINEYSDLQNAKNTDDLKNRNKIVSKVVDEFYKNNYQLLTDHKKRIANAWNPLENEFYESTKYIFGDYPWPEGKYIGYVSMFNINPRNLSNKTFQCYFNNVNMNYSNITIAHEMLHFIWFDYLDTKISDFKKRYSDDEIWLLSEAFNEIVQSLPIFKSFEDQGGYPDASSLVQSLKKYLPKDIFTIQEFFKIAGSVYKPKTN